MREPTTVGAYWGARAEPVEHCAERFASCLEELGTAHHLLSSWWRKGQSKNAASRHPVSAERSVLRDLLLAGRNRGDFSGEVLEDLGYSAGLWNKQRVSVGLSIHCGSYNERVGNALVLKLPVLDAESAVLYDPTVGRRIMHAVIESWSPEWATWITPSVRDAQDDRTKAPVVGWWTYLDGAPSAPQTLPAGVRVERTKRGTLIMLADRADAVSAGAAVKLRDEFREAGAFTRAS